MALIFRFNPIEEPVDSTPSSSDANPPMRYDYQYTKQEIGGKTNVQVKITIKDSDDKTWERKEEFLVDLKDVEECVKQSIQNYLMKFGLKEDDVEKMFEEFKLDESKKDSYWH